MGKKRIDGDELAERVAGIIGSWRFIGALSILLALWFAWNAIGPTLLRFDGFPFFFCNLFMSAMAALTGPMLLIAANAGAKRDRAQVARIESVESTLDEHVNVTAKQHTEELRVNTELTREIHRLLSSDRPARDPQSGRYTKRKAAVAA